MPVISVRVEKSGRVLIPAAIRRQLGLKEGESELLLNIDEQTVQVSTRAQAVSRIQEWARRYVEPSRRVSQELIEERRGEFIRESED